MNAQNARTGAHECLLQSCWCMLASWYMPDGLWTLMAVCPVPSGEVASKTSLGQRFDQDMKLAPSFLNMELTSQCLIHKESGGSMYVKTEVASIFIKWIIYYVFLTEKKKNLTGQKKQKHHQVMCNLPKQEDLIWRGKGGSLVSIRLPGTCSSQWADGHGLPGTQQMPVCSVVWVTCLHCVQKPKFDLKKVSLELNK